MFLETAHTLAPGSIITFDNGYVDYGQYETFTGKGIFYITRLKDNALYRTRQEYEISDDADAGVLKDLEIILYYGAGKREKHRA